LNPYLNFHRPYFFPETRTDAKGKQRKIYRYENMMTPYDKLKSLPGAKDYLKPDLSFEILDQFAHQISDNQAADQLQPKVGASRRRPARHASKPFMDGRRKPVDRPTSITLFQTHLWIGKILPGSQRLVTEDIVLSIAEVPCAR